MRLRKSSTDKVLFGVCGGLAEHFGWDPTAVRVIFALAAIFGFGTFIVIYLVLAFVMPNN